jgi:hypothetical protein
MLPKLPTACLRPIARELQREFAIDGKGEGHAPVGIDRAEGLLVAGRLDQATGKSQMRALPRQSGHPFRAEFLGRCPGGRTAHRRGCHKKDEKRGRAGMGHALQPYPAELWPIITDECRPCETASTFPITTLPTR